MAKPGRDLQRLQKTIVACRRCPRLVRWREEVAQEKVKRFAGEEYWGKPIPGFGDPQARLLIVGLAPAAHGGNRTGRMFTGDNSGNWLYRALHRAGFASQPESLHRNDGLTLNDCYITATLRCCPPKNLPTREEIAACSGYLLNELQLLTRIRVVVGLGRLGFEAALGAYRALGMVASEARPKFSHRAIYALGRLAVIASFHPSQQNTFTGRLTESMLDDVFIAARSALGS
jgi:uracil-DNA glycosylase